MMVLINSIHITQVALESTILLSTGEDGFLRVIKTGRHSNDADSHSIDHRIAENSET